MRMMRIGAVILACAGATGGALAQQAGGDAAVDPARLEQRLAAVETLLERSSAARQVEASGDAAARQKRERGRERFREARAAYQSGQHERAAALLQEASVQMFEAVRLSAPAEVTGPGARAAYDARLDSVKALHAALLRVAAEKPGAPGVAETSREIEGLTRDAQRLAGAGQLEAGRAALERAYFLARAAVSSLRSGDTLVRSLHFANAEEEYRYEVDRNDTHQMLVKVLLDGKPRTAGQQSLMDKASQLRTRADAAAAAADHAAAVKLLEEATRELVRAIRSAGVFIPG